MSICVETISAAPLGSEKVKVNVADDPLPLDGETDTVDGGCAPTLVTVNDAVLLCVNEPLVPLTVIVDVLAADELVVLMVNVELPEPDMDAGLKLAVVPAGSPDAFRLTAPEKPLLPVTVTV